MAKSIYPTGVGNRGGTLHIWFIHRGTWMRGSPGVSDTPKNRKVAGELRVSVCFTIKAGSFNHAAQFPDSLNLKKFGVENKEITVLELVSRWLELKRMEISINVMSRYSSTVRSMTSRADEDKLVSAAMQKDLLLIRKELLTGHHVSKTGQKTPVKGGSVRTINNYMRTMSDMFNFAADGGYVKANPSNGISVLKRSHTEPGPLTREELIRLINACTHQQLKSVQSLIVYTGVRHGELVSIAWEDTDLKAGAMIIRRNHTLTKELTLLRTGAETDQIINLIQSAIDVLKNQAEMTRLGKQYQVEAKLCEYSHTDVLPFAFVFNPQIVLHNSRAGYHYAVRSVSQSREAATWRVGIRYHRAYQSRHTYVCWSLAASATLTLPRSRWTTSTRKRFTGCIDSG